MIVDTITEAKAQLSALVSLVESGEEIIIKRAGKPVAVLVKYEAARKRRKPGAFKGEITISDDFDTLPEDIAAAFGAVSEVEERYQTKESTEKGGK